MGRVPNQNMRAAILAAAMNLTPIAAVDILRFLRVPAIIMTVRARRGRACGDTDCAPRIPATRAHGIWRRRAF